MIKSNKRKILFYCASIPTVMLYKIARVLKKNGYSAILFTMCEKHRFNHKFYSEVFDKIVCSNFQFFKISQKSVPYFFKRIFSLFKFSVLLKFSKPYIWIGAMGGNWQLRLVHKYFLKKSPFIYFPYDIISHFFGSREEALKTTKNFEINAERYCLENADGIMHKGNPDELKYLNGRIHENLNIVPLQLNFMPYCSKEFIIQTNIPKLQNKDKEIHIVSAGYMSNHQKSIEGFSELVNKLSRQKIHMHVYMLIDHISKEKEKEYIKNFFSSVIKNAYFHLHDSLGPKELIREMSKYDFGFFTYAYTKPENIEITLCMGNKLSSYLEAGLPSICYEKTKFMSDMIEKNGMGVSFNLDNIGKLKQKLKKLNYKKMVKNVEMVREDFDMDKNFIRLKQFIDVVINSKSRQNFKNKENI